ncbi:MAG: L2 family class A beta-lactamase [Stenotrophomonas sp.]|jgi:beta-lactamase class A|uniref:L2 family extended-spectrum class A beta-lactamase n=1 Tax=Stenotrophomonas sp. TaxID=69392 RepID=UPI0029A537AB|nr:L2 family extended-spectrum class A beta-lactamase [Stenotrophomonas sp.]MDX3930847.1 L2 family class A beta-lactamase [Stenotrophomonas sp.]
MLSRRHFLQTSALALASSLAVPGLARSAPGPAAATIATAADFAALEKASGGRLGVTLLDTRTGKRVGHRQDERFPMCSTIKWMLAAAALHRAERQPGFLDERLPMRAEDLIDHAPTTRRHVGKDLSVRDLCRTTMVTSDNPAANLLLRHLGGPPALTAFMRSHGDAVTRSDRYEPELNRFTLGDPRDTTSPAASAASLQRFVLGDALRPASRQQLADWLIDNETGDATLRAGLGKRWRVGDKTGSNGKDTRNDIGVLWPLGGGTAWVLTAYLQGASVDSGQRDAVLARVAALAERMIG